MNLKIKPCKIEIGIEIRIGKLKLKMQHCKIEIGVGVESAILQNWNCSHAKLKLELGLKMQSCKIEIEFEDATLRNAYGDDANGEWLLKNIARFKLSR